MFPSWIIRVFGLSTKPSRQQRRAPRASARNRCRVPLALEALEDRLVFSATITDLGVLPSDTSSFATAINASGQVAGYSGSITKTIEQRPFLYSNGQMTNLGTFGGPFSWASGINSSGQVVGESETSSGDQHAFLYSNGNMTDLGTLVSRPTLTQSEAVGINNSGQVVLDAGPVGSFGPSPTNLLVGSSAFLYSNGQITDLGILTTATAINNSGQVVGGEIINPSSLTYHAFLYSDGQTTDLGTLPGGTSSFAYGIDDSGQVVGVSDTSSGAEHAFLYSNGQMTDLGTLPGDMGSTAYGINDSGQVVGDSTGKYGETADPFLYSNGRMIGLNSLLPANSGWSLEHAFAINDSDQIAGEGSINGQEHAFLLNLNNTTSSAATVTTNPSNQSVTVGQSATFTAAASGIPNPSVQWQVSTDRGNTWSNLSNGGNVSGATSTTLSLRSVAAAMSGYQYEAVFSNGIGSPATSNAAILTVTATTLPHITTQSASQSVIAGQTATFTAAASGTPTPTVQWQVRTAGGSTWSNISDATSTTLTINRVQASQNGSEYRAVFTNSAGTAATNAAALTVNQPPAITSGNSITFTSGQGGSFLVTATGLPTPGLTEFGALPSGVTFRNNGNGTATLSGTPAPGAAGTYHIAIVAGNSTLPLAPPLTAMQSFTLTVSPIPPVEPPLLAFFNRVVSILPFVYGTETVNVNNGTTTIADSFFGIPLLVSTFGSSGNLLTVDLFGFLNVTFLFELL